MSALVLIDDLEARGILVFVEGPDRLRIRGPEAALTEELLGRLRESKAELLDHLRQRPQPAPCCTAYDGPDYPSPGADLGPPTHSLADIPVICRVHLSDEHEGGQRWEVLRCRQPDGDGLVGWAVVADDCYLEIVRERGVIRPLPVRSPFTSTHLKERRR